jgi:pimeloyl-ACP methyl ester carboxylesterase
MASFVLIHGAFHGGWCFDPLVEILRGRGHAVSAPTLPGMGGDEAALRAATLDAWADFTLQQCAELRAENGGPLILAGHSRGGLVIGAAAERDPAMMDHLAYICAMLVPEAARLDELAGAMPAHPELAAAGTAVGNGAGMVVDPEVGRRYFGQNVPEKYAALAGRLVAEPVGPLSTPLHLTPGRWGSVPRTYVECLQDRTMPIANQRQMLALSPGTQVVTLDSDHSPFFTMPEQLADALDALA